MVEHGAHQVQIGLFEGGQGVVGHGIVEAGKWADHSTQPKLEAGSWKLEAGSWKLEAGSWKLEAGSWKAA
ncbi:hypothetical protein ACFPTY_12345 [Halomonas beimenensis]|uniref:hypothetical protein n=1 Tax=Halomonas beimenensis TaxID=475662 RepID=UPI00361EFFE6